MEQVPREMSEEFERRLEEARIPAPERPEYRRWLRFYIDFCCKYGHQPASASSLGPFLMKLASKNQSIEKRNQAALAVRLHLRAAVESEGTPSRTVERSGEQRGPPRAAPLPVSGKQDRGSVEGALAQRRIGEQSSPARRGTGSAGFPAAHPQIKFV